MFDRGDRLRKARETAGIQVQAMAELLDVERGTITRYEKNRGVRRWVVEAYAKATGLDFEWLQTGYLGDNPDTLMDTSGYPQAFRVAA